MTSINVTPMVGSRVASTAPFDYSDAMTLLQKVDALRDVYNSLVTQENTNAEAYSTLVQQVNEYVQNAVQGVNDATGQYNAQLAELKQTSDTLASQVGDGETSLKAATDAANQALTNATALSAQIAAEMSQMQAGNNVLSQQAQQAIAQAKNKVDKSHLVYDVTDYGARGDGVTDDTAAIQKAIDAAGEGAVVFFPNLVYNVSGTLVTHRYQTLQGTTQQQAGPAAGSLSYGIHSSIASGPTILVAMGCIVERLRVVGPGVTNANSVGISVPQGSATYTMRDVSVDSFGTGIYVEQSWYGYIERAYVTNCSLGIDYNYCYNQTLISPRMNTAKDANGIPGDCVQLNRASMLTIVGGSMENFNRGVVVRTNCHCISTGLYFETATGQNAKCYAFDGLQGSLVVTGNEVYMENTVFIDMPDTSGDKVISMGNRIKGGTTGTTSEIVYNFAPNNSKNFRFIVLHDECGAMNKSVKYLPDNYVIPPASLYTFPIGVTTGSRDMVDGTFYVGGGVEIQSSSQPLGIPAGTSWPSMSNYTGRDGAMFYRTDTNKVGFWDGSTWRDAQGTAL